MKNTIAIIGSHPKTRTEFDFSRDDCDIWLFNEALSTQWAKRADAVFQMHAETIWRNPGNRNDPKHYEWLQSQTSVPVYMQDVYPDVPKSVKYPLDEIVNRFAISYFTSSVAYALALACYLGYKRIELYGVEMETNTEYSHQRPGVALWLGVARGLGIELDIHGSVFDQPLYGYEGEVTVPYSHFGERVAQMIPQRDELSAQYKAAFEDLKKAFDLLGEDGSQKTEQILFAAAEKQRTLSRQLGEISGRIQENQRYQGKADVMKEASGGEYIFSRQEFESAAIDLKKQADQTNVEYIGAGTTLDHIHRNVKAAAKKSPKRIKLLDTYKQAIQQYFIISNKVGVLTGASKENYEYLSWLDEHIRAAGGSKSEAVLLEQMQNA